MVCIAAGTVALLLSLVLWARSYARVDMLGLRVGGGQMLLISGKGQLTALCQAPASGPVASWHSSDWASLPPGAGMRESFSYQREEYPFASEDGAPVQVRSYELTLPFWAVAGGSMMVTLLAGAWARRERRLQRITGNRCPACGYDLRATPGRCPECGQAV